ncbi:MAG: hypothetical protein ACI8UO_006230 [Verrucomicrobiales bacterium]|jgi:hypothetical protein
MKTPTSSIACVALFAAALAPLGQTMAEDSPAEAARRALSDRVNGNRSTGTTESGGATIVAPKQQTKTITTITYTAVSSMREWTRKADGVTMLAHLLAFAAPKDGEKGPVIVVYKNNVRFLLDGGNKKPIDYPLAELSEEDQEFVMRIAEAAKNGPPRASKPTMKKPETAPYEPLKKETE